MNSKHTPGPWEVSYGNEGSIFGDLDNPEHDGDNPYIGKVDGIKWDGGQWPEAEANARLIAEAPAMFELLEKIFWAGQRQPEHLQDLINEAGRLTTRITSPL